MRSRNTTLYRWLSNRWLQLAVVLAIAFALRFVDLSTAPLGYFHDEAWSAAKAQSIITGAEPPQVYFAENNGMDALHVYLIALLFLFTGPLAIGSRLVSALLGGLTVLATYWAAYELFNDDRHRHAIALTAAFVLAILFGAIATSRSGWHSSSMALFSTLCLAALVRGRRLGRHRWFVAAGVLGGLAQYTYPSARFVVLLLIWIALVDLWRRRTERRSVLMNYLLLFAVAAIVVAPLALYFIQNPEWFFARAQQVTESVDVLQNLVNTAAGFLIRGDPDNLHNLPGRPMLDPILGVFFLIGLFICIFRRRSSGLILVTGLVILSLPVVLTGQAPLTRRWTGAMPLAAIIVAVGVESLVQAITTHWVSLRSRLIAVGAVSALLIISTGWAIADYFGSYVGNPQLFWAYDAGITQVASYIRGHPEETIFLTPYDRFYQVIALTLDEAQRPPIQSYNGMACALFPEVTDRVTEWVVVDEKDQVTVPAMQRLFPNSQIVWKIRSPVGSYARALRVPAGQTAQLQLDQRRSADFGGKIQLIGYTLPASVRAGDTLRLKLALKDTAPLEQLYKIFAHVRSTDGAVLAQDDHAPCGLTLNEADWRPGNIVLEEYQVPIPANTPPGEYPVVIGLYQDVSGARLPVLSSALDHNQDSVILGKIQIN